MMQVILCAIFCIVPTSSLRVVKQEESVHWGSTKDRDQFDDEWAWSLMTARDKLDDMEMQVELEAAENFTPSKELIQTWIRSYKKFTAVKLSLPDQCKEEIRKWAQAVRGNGFSRDETRGIAHSECADPFSGKESCSKVYELPMYRLGDAVLYGSGKLHTYISKFFPKSIGAKYIAKIGSHKVVSISKLNEVLDGEEYGDFERPHPNELVVHLRLGHAYAGMKMSDNYYHSKIDQIHAQKLNITSVTLVYGDHNIKQLATLQGADATTSGSYQAIYRHIEKIEGLFQSGGFEVNKRVNFNADCDVIYMANAPYFIKAGGGFSRVVSELVERRGGKVM